MQELKRIAEEMKAFQPCLLRDYIHDLSKIADRHRNSERSQLFIQGVGLVLQSCGTSLGRPVALDRSIKKITTDVIERGEKEFSPFVVKDTCWSRKGSYCIEARYGVEGMTSPVITAYSLEAVEVEGEEKKYIETSLISFVL